MGSHFEVQTERASCKTPDDAAAENGPQAAGSMIRDDSSTVCVPLLTGQEEPPRYTHVTFNETCHRANVSVKTNRRQAKFVCWVEKVLKCELGNHDNTKVYRCQNTHILPRDIRNIRTHKMLCGADDMR